MTITREIFLAINEMRNELISLSNEEFALQLDEVSSDNVFSIAFDDFGLPKLEDRMSCELLTLARQESTSSNWKFFFSHKLDLNNSEDHFDECFMYDEQLERNSSFCFNSSLSQAA